MPTTAGIITPVSLSNIICDKTRLVSIMLVNNEIGTIQPIKELCTVAHANGTLFHTDAVQGVGHLKIDVQDLGIDMLSASAHKFNGPKGIGFLYIRRGTQISSYADGGTQEFSRRAGTENVASIVGMAAALKGNCDCLDVHSTSINMLEHQLLNKLSAANIPYKRNGGEKTLPGLISLSFAGADAEAIYHRMDLAGICIATGSACNSGSTEISHVLKAISLNKEQAKGTIRISLGKNNTKDDVEQIIHVLKILDDEKNSKELNAP